MWLLALVALQSCVMKQYPAEAADLFNACEDMAKKRYQSYVRMTKMDWSE